MRSQLRPLAAPLALVGLLVSAVAATAAAPARQAPAVAPGVSAPGASTPTVTPGVPTPTVGAPATPVATDDATYAKCGRVFPDPQAYGPGGSPLPTESPWAKGNQVCRATDFIQYDEAIDGLHYLEQKFPRFVKVFNLRTDFADVLDVAHGDGRSAGLPTNALTRNRADLYMVRITDENVPKSKKKNFLYTLSIHGIERAGVEGGLRAAEDLATWAATTPKQPIMETNPDSLPVGKVLKKSIVWFAMNNPDGWRRGDTDRNGLAYQRYNGNGVDLNRDWPEKGFTFRPYTPASEPETSTFVKVLKHISPHWAGGVDLHGQLIDRAFSFTLLGASQRPFDKNQRMLQFTRGAYRDAEERLSWNPLIKPNDAPPGCVPPGTGGTVNPPPCDPTPRVYGVQFGSIWDTIAYTVTGAIGDWADSDLGLGADFIDNEMSLSHISNCVTGKCFIPSAEQLHVDGNKSLIYAMLNYTLLPEDTGFRPVGRTAYLTRAHRLVNKGHSAPKPHKNWPLQDPINANKVKLATGVGPSVEFHVLPKKAHRSNEGLKAQVTFTNIQGVGPGAVLGIAVDKFNGQEAEPGGSKWTTLNEDYNQSETYLQSGMQVDANDLTAGRYRVRITGAGAAQCKIKIKFTKGRAWPDPGQKPYNISNVDFFEELRAFTHKKTLTPIKRSKVADGKVDLDRFDTVIAIDGTLGKNKKLPGVLHTFAQRGGNLVLTDDALYGLEAMKLLPKDSVSTVPVYAGSVSFQGNDPYADPLARNVHEPGAAEGPNHRKQTSEPVPVGFSIQDANGGDQGSLPQAGVDPDVWTAAHGRTVGLIGDSEDDLVTYGELKVGKGDVRILGSVLPFPTEKYAHPFGLSAYAITPTAYVMLRNLISYDRSKEAGTGSGTGTTGGSGGGNAAAGGSLATTGMPTALTGAGALMLIAAVMVRGVRRRRRLG